MNGKNNYDRLARNTVFEENTFAFALTVFYHFYVHADASNTRRIEDDNSEDTKHGTCISGSDCIRLQIELDGSANSNIVLLWLS